MKLKKRLLSVITYSLCLFITTAVISMTTTLPGTDSEKDDYIASETTEDYGVAPASDDEPPIVNW